MLDVVSMDAQKGTQKSPEQAEPTGNRPAPCQVLTRPGCRHVATDHVSPPSGACTAPTLSPLPQPHLHQDMSAKGARGNWATGQGRMPRGARDNHGAPPHEAGKARRGPGGLRYSS